MAKIVKKSPAPLYLAAAVWAAWAVLAPLYAWWHFALAAAVSAAAWLGGRKLFPDKVLILPDPEPAPEREPERAAPEDPLAVERARALAELRRLDENIEDAKLSAQIVHMEEVTGKIFDIVAGQPAKLPQLRRFLNYYLPTTLKLLNAYDRMGAAGVEGANIDGTMGRIDAMMDKPMLYYAFEILYWCGIREGELLALTPADFDFEKKTLRINKSYQRLQGKDVITTPKTKKSNRVIQMPDFLCDEMQDYFKQLYGLESDSRIFPLTKHTLKRGMEFGCKASGVKVIRIHDLRHSHVSLLINMGYSAVAIGNRVGHESVEITYRYAHLFPTVQKEMADKLNIERSN